MIRSSYTDFRIQAIPGSQNVQVILGTSDSDLSFETSLEDAHYIMNTVLAGDHMVPSAPAMAVMSLTPVIGPTVRSSFSSSSSSSSGSSSSYRSHPIKRESGTSNKKRDRTSDDSGGTKEETCSICLDDRSRRHAWYNPTNCNHIYCKPCIETWFKINKKCPLCNKASSGIRRFYFSSRKRTRKI